MLGGEGGDLAEWTACPLRQDGIGIISYTKLHSLLTHNKTPKRPVNAKGPYALDILRQEMPMGPDVRLTLRHALAGRTAQVIGLLSSWDDSSTGLVSRRDFWRALSLLGLRVSKVDFDMVFEWYRPENHVDTIPLKWLQRKLHQDLKAMSPSILRRPPRSRKPPVPSPRPEELCVRRESSQRGGPVEILFVRTPERQESGGEPVPARRVNTSVDPVCSEPLEEVSEPRFPEEEAALTRAREAKKVLKAELEEAKEKAGELAAEVEANGGKARCPELSAASEEAMARCREQLEPALAASRRAVKGAEDNLQTVRMLHARKLCATRMNELAASNSERYCNIMNEVGAELRRQASTTRGSSKAEIEGGEVETRVRKQRKYPTRGRGLPGQLGPPWVNPGPVPHDIFSRIPELPNKRLPDIQSVRTSESREASALEPIRKLMTMRLPALLQIFHTWDLDCNGTISLFEMQNALGTLDIPVTDKKAMMQIFEVMDTDQTGSIDFAELRHALMREQPRHTMPQISVDQTKLARRRVYTNSSMKDRADVEAAQNIEECVQKIKDLMANNLTKVTDLFRKWDKNLDGLITLDELRRALAALSVPIDEKLLKRFFKLVDVDGSGSIEFGELNAILRKQQEQKASWGKRVQQIIDIGGSHGLGGGTHPGIRSTQMLDINSPTSTPLGSNSTQLATKPAFTSRDLDLAGIARKSSLSQGSRVESSARGRSGSAVMRPPPLV